MWQPDAQFKVKGAARHDLAAMHNGLFTKQP